VKLITLLHIVSKLMRGDVPPLSQYVFITVWWLSNGYVFMAWYLVKHKDNFKDECHIRLVLRVPCLGMYCDVCNVRMRNFRCTFFTGTKPLIDADTPELPAYL
jgi:hypothetical protein